MRYPGFVGGSYKSQAVTAAGMRTVNFYEERIEDPAGTSRKALYPTPGVELIADTTATQGRAHLFINGREFAVVGTSFTEYDSDGVETSRGTVAIDSNPASISSNGDGGGQLFITSGGNGYVFNLATNVLTSIAALAGKATMGDALDGYFLALDADTGTMYSSELLAGLTWTTGVMFAQRNAAPDPWISMKVKGKYIYLFGDQTGEVWYDSGAAPFPFAPHPSGLIQYGTAAAWSVAVCDDSLVWLGSSKSGRGSVMRATGFSPEVVASYPVQFAMGGYGTVSDAYADSYNEAGHTFYVLGFPTESRTWCFDLQMGAWHERGTWNPTARVGDFSIWGPRCHAFAFGEHRWLHGTGTGLYRSSLDLGLDVDDLPIVRERTAPTIEDENKLVFFGAIELLLDVGLGVTSGQGENPQVMMSFSRDGGRTWTKERWASAGKIGEYRTRVRWERMGSARRGLVRVRFSDPIPWRIVDALVDLIQSIERRSA